MSELPVITYTDSEGQVFNFMSDLDDVRDEDTETILVPRTTPEEPLDVDLDIIDSEISDYDGRKKKSTTWSYKSINNIWGFTDKRINGDIVYLSGETLSFSLPFEQGEKFDIPGTESPAIDEKIQNSYGDYGYQHSFPRISNVKIDESLEVVNDLNVTTEIWRCEFELDNEYFYEQFEFFISFFVTIIRDGHPAGSGTLVSFTSERVDDLSELIGVSYTKPITPDTWFSDEDYATLRINDITITENRIIVDYLMEWGFEQSENIRSRSNVTYRIRGTISSVHDDGVYSYIRHWYYVRTGIGQNVTYGYKDYYKSEYIFVFNDEEIVLPDVVGAAVQTENGDIVVTKAEKRYVDYTESGFSDVYIEVMLRAPSGYDPSLSKFHYSYPEELDNVYVEKIEEITSSLYAKVDLSYPISEDFSVENVKLHVYYEYPDDTIYKKLFYCGRIIDGSFHEFEWDKSVSERQFGETVNGWTKSSKEYKATLLFSGTDEQKRLVLNRFHSAIENDIMRETPGTLRWDDATIDCYIRGSNTKPSDKFNGYAENEITIYCPRPFWEHELTQQFYSGINNSESDTTYVKNWPHDYSGYDYLFINDRESYIFNDGPLSEWQIIINGPARKPIIHIGNNIIAMNTEIPVDSYLMIDSRDKIIYLVNPDGSMDNRFGERDLENYIFEKIEPGYSKVTWNGSYEWLLTLYEERSEPRWPY